MPESPDFDQIARRVLDVVLEDVEGLDMMSAAQERWSERVTEQIAEQLRQVWTARGAADLKTLEPIIGKLGDTMDPDNARVFVTDALRSVDLLPCECGCGKLVAGGMMEAAHPDDYRDERG